MRSQAGASSVAIDMESGIVTIHLTAPRRIDFKAIELGVKNAGYELKTLHLTTVGEADSGPCKIEKKDADFVVISATEQRLETVGKLKGDKIKGSVSDWRDHPRVTLE